MKPDNTSHEIRDAGHLQYLLQALRQSRGASLALEDTGDGMSWVVRLLDITPGEALRLDIGAATELKPLLKAGEAFRLIGEVEGAMVRTAPLTLHDGTNAAGRGHVSCEYPSAVEVAYRRAAFRADLTDNLSVSVELVRPGRDEPVQGGLKNLSMGGCLMEVPLWAAVDLYGEQQTTRLTAQFPNGQRLQADGRIRHVRPDDRWSAGLVGYEFIAATQDFERRLWYFVHETERQRAYEESDSNRTFAPSELFVPAANTRRESTSGAGKRPPAITGSMGRKLAGVTACLDAQLLQLLSGGPIAVKPLRRQSETLLGLLNQHREALLYAIAGIGHEPVLVRHGLSVAVRLADLAISQELDSDALPAIVACALIHDFGKALLPPSVWPAPDALDAEQRAILGSHVQLLTARLNERDTLPTDIVAAVIEQGNERLDGSGYPQALGENELPELARMMAVVDVADAMRRDRADREAWPQVDVYRHLLLAHAQFDNAWVQRYIRRFSMTPIGALARYSSGKLAWIQRLDGQGKPAQVKVVMNLSNRRQHIEQILHENSLEQLGHFEEIVEAREYGLIP